MNLSVSNSELFTCRCEYLKALFSSCIYPWEMLPKLKEYIASLISDGIPEFEPMGNMVLVGKGAVIHPSAVIMRYTIIGKGCRRRPGEHIRGNVITGSNCVIGNSCEVKNSILLDDVHIPHYNYVGDSVLGNRAHMGAGAVCSNLKSDGSCVVIHTNPPIRTDIRKIGGILADGADVGCGCVLNPGTVVGKNTRVYPLTSMRGVYPPDSIVKSNHNICKIQNHPKT